MVQSRKTTFDTCPDGQEGESDMRIDYWRTVPGALKAMLGLQHYIQQSSLEPGLVKLIEVRASVMNGCAYCVDMHTKDARVLGESEQRLYAVPVWRETPFFTERERAALAWTEIVTDVGRTGIPDSAFNDVRAWFSEAETVELTMVIVTINGWNRLSVAFRPEPGSYQPRAAGTEAQHA
jgi:AhpD family alkylhydroperoxidase